MLDPEEREVLEQVADLATVEDFIAEYVEEIERKSKHGKAWKKVYAFSQFAAPVLDVFKQANLSPECSVALGLLGLLLIQVRQMISKPSKPSSNVMLMWQAQPLNNKSDIEDRLEAELSQITRMISQVKFSQNMIPSSEIDTEVEGICAAIIDFLLHALQYQKKWGIGECRALRRTLED